MNSKCPSCAKSIEHEDFLFEVTCSCGMAFNPFYDANIAVDEPGTHVPAAHAPSANAPAYQEAASAFRDIVAFGEGGDDAEPTPQAAPVPEKATPAKTMARTASDGGVAVETSESHRILVAGDRLEGYGVEGYLGPISASAAIDWESENPLEPAFRNAWNACERAGGNALLYTRWELSPDGGRCLVAGVPVRCQKL